MKLPESTFMRRERPPALRSQGPSVAVLILARAAQGTGAAFVTPLSLTILSDAISAARRPLALGAWGAISGLAIAVGPVVGGAITQGISWHWIFWVNVPIGILAVALAGAAEEEGGGGRVCAPMHGVLLELRGELPHAQAARVRKQATHAGGHEPSPPAFAARARALTAGGAGLPHRGRRHRAARARLSFTITLLPTASTFASAETHRCSNPSASSV